MDGAETIQNIRQRSEFLEACYKNICRILVHVYSEYCLAKTIDLQTPYQNLWIIRRRISEVKES